MAWFRGGVLRALLVSIYVLLLAVPAWAQTGGQLRGTVFDDFDFGVPNVELTLRGRSLIGGEQTRKSDENGTFQFVELPPGAYDLTVRFEGYATVTYKGIQVAIGRTATQVVRLEPSESEGSIVVTPPPAVVDVEDVGRGTVLTKEFLQRIPTGRTYHDATKMVAGVLNGANPSMGGAGGNENIYMLNGANITDPVTGTFTLNFNYDVIQQIDVMLGGFMPEHGQALGGIINIVTESGGNNLEFDTSIFYTNGNWRDRKDARYTADGFQLQPTDFDTNLQTVQIAGKVSGPIVRDRAWFIVSYQHSRALTANIGIPLPRDFDGHYVLGNLTVQPNSAHRLTGFLQLNPSAIDNLKQADVFVKPEAQARQYQGGFVGQLRWQWFMGSKANLDTMVVVQQTFIEQGSVPCTHNTDLGYHPCKPGEAEGNEDWETPGRIGQRGAFDSVNLGRFYFDNRMRYQASSKLSVLSIDDPLGGSHDVKIGIEGVQTVWDQLQGNSGNLIYNDFNTIGWDPLSFTNWYRVETTGPINFRTSGSMWNAFVQDSWKPLNNLVIKGGVRYDNAIMRNDIGEPVVAQSLWGPRLYAAWDPFGDQKTKIAGGYGRFNDAGRLGVAAFTSKSAIGAKYWLGEIGEGGSLVSNQDAMLIYQPRENPAIAHDTLRAPRSDEFNLILNRQILRDIGVSTEGTYRMTRFIFEYDDRNLIYDEDGSAVIGARFGDNQVSRFRMRTPELARRDYVQWDTSVYKVFSRRWFARATYTYAVSMGTSPQALSGAFRNGPQTQYNYGPMLQTDVRHAVKAFGSVELPTDPWNQTFGFTFEYYAGRPLERFYPGEEPPPGPNYNVRIRERGAYTRLPPEWNLGFQFTQDFDVGKGKVQAQIQLLNAFNNRAPVNFLGAFYTENRLFATQRQDPLRVQVGARYLF